ncbi:MAG: hypothetical protein Kow0032_18520 [Methyloligellaceae bacterium]
MLSHYAETGAGDVASLHGYDVKRIRSGGLRAIFTESASRITVIDIGTRATIYRAWPRR